MRLNADAQTSIVTALATGVIIALVTFALYIWAVGVPSKEERRLIRAADSMLNDQNLTKWLEYKGQKLCLTKRQPTGLVPKGN